MKQIFKVLTDNKDFYPRLYKIAIPIIIDFLISSLVNLLDVFMVGKLGEPALAAVGIGSRFFFLSILLMVGIGSGAAVFTAQYWGKKDIKKIKPILGISLTLTTIASIIFSLISLILPAEIMGLFTNDPIVINLGIDYIRILGIGQIFFGISISFFSILTSTENVKFTMSSTALALIFDTIISYLLIFGIGIFPELGVIGVAIGTFFGRFFQLILILFFTYFFKLPAAGKLKELFSFSWSLFRKYLDKAIPVILQHVIWGLGSIMFVYVYAQLSTESIAAYQAAATIEEICLLFFTGIGISASIMIGNRIGANEEKKSINYSEKFLVIIYILSFIIMLILLLVKDIVAGLFNVSPLSKSYISSIIFVLSIAIWGKASNILFYTGILKGGGDTRFCMILDIGGMWLIGVPIAFIAAFTFNFPIHIIIALISIDEFIKMIIGYKRFLSRKWIHNLTEK
ncbi:MAG: MATE family efflux transporter [Candidatus Lokiarchaeota archaeon]|nr:MATE family efflux transporter [Candidatus Lokiarchaeota archaeon]